MSVFVATKDITTLNSRNLKFSGRAYQLLFSTELKGVEFVKYRKKKSKV